MFPRCLVVALAAVASGCATAPMPYQFGSPLIDGVTAALEPLEAARPATARARRRGTAAAGPAGHLPAAMIQREDLALPLPPEELPDPVDITGLPAPHRAPMRVLPLTATPADLRAMTGARTRHDPVAFAVLAASALTGNAGPDQIPTDGETLLAWAKAHASEVAAADAVPGDLLVFDRTDGDAPASLWAVMLGRDDRGVIEMLYVATGVVRRGFVDPARPHVGRGADRAIRNTFLRHGKHWPPAGTRFLSGELLGRVVRLR